MIAGTVSVELRLQGPILVHGLGAGAFGIDAGVLRDGDGVPIIPGTLMLGKVRDPWAVPASVMEGDRAWRRPDADAWLGEPVKARKRLNDLFLCQTTSSPPSPRWPRNGTKTTIIFPTTLWDIAAIWMAMRTGCM